MHGNGMNLRHKHSISSSTRGSFIYMLHAIVKLILFKPPGTRVMSWLCSIPFCNGIEGRNYSKEKKPFNLHFHSLLIKKLNFPRKWDADLKALLCWVGCESFIAVCESKELFFLFRFCIVANWVVMKNWVSPLERENWFSTQKKEL